jgi:hypothetical protein
MGMFTRVVEKNGKGKIQIKFGNFCDECQTYKIGDLVPFKITDTPGIVECGDGVYEGLPEWTDKEKYWVIIKNHKIINTILNFEDNEEEYNYLSMNWGQYNFLVKHYSVENYKHEWWSDEEWESHKKWLEERKEKSEKEYQDYLKRTNFEDNLASRLVFPFFNFRINYSDIGRKIIQVEDINKREK